MIGCYERKMERLLVIFLPLLFSQALATSPLLIWNSYEAPGKIPAIPALGSTSYTSLWKEYLQAFPSENIILFMQDAMSIEDLTSFPKENAKLNKLVSESHHLYLPKVEETSSLQNDFKTAGYNIVEVSNKLSGLKLAPGKNLVLIPLPETLSIPQRKLAMQKTNEVIDSALSKIGGLEKFTCIFTANQTSLASSESSSSVKRRVTRSLQQAASKPEGFHNSTCALIFLRRDIDVNVFNEDGTLNETFKIPNNKSVSDADTGHCEEGLSSVQITYRDVEDVHGTTTPTEIRLEFKFVFTKKSKWTLLLVEGNLDTKAPRDLIFQMDKRQNEVVPLRMSYSCSVKRILKSSNATTNGKTMQMVLNGFQYEAFPQGAKVISTSKFDGAWDCVGFFTIPVWMSLITVLIFLIILFWGLWMLADVKTMDRFDDPKGKSIVIPNAD